MSLFTRYLMLIAFAVIAASSGTGVAYHASGIGWDGGTGVSASPATPYQSNGIGWD